MPLGPAEVGQGLIDGMDLAQILLDAIALQVTKRSS
jgi:hypothetical protein